MEMQPKFVVKERNYSGTTQCYAIKKVIRTFVVEVRLSADVNGELLQKAVDKALVRLPYCRQSVVRKGSLFYYAENDLPFEVAEHDGPRPVGGAETNYHALDVAYKGSLIFFSMAHALCDGLGFNRFIEAVLYHYMCLKDDTTYDDSSIYTEKVPFDEAELFDPLQEKLDIPSEEMDQIKAMAAQDVRYHLPEFGEPGNIGPVMYRLPVKIKTEDFIGWCKANASSPAAAAAAIMGKAIARVCDVREGEGEVVGVIPCSMRKLVPGAEKTFKNCSSVVFISMAPVEVNELPVGELAARARTTLKTKLGDGTANRMYSGMNKLVHLGAMIPTYTLKCRLLAGSEKNPQNTFFVDYVGGLTANGYGDQIVDVRYLNADIGCPALFVLMSETAGHFHVNLTQSFEGDAYYQAFCEVLEEAGIPFERLPAESYMNPTVSFPRV